LGVHMCTHVVVYKSKIWTTGFTRVTHHFLWKFS